VCVVFRDENEDAVRLVSEMKLEQLSSHPLIQMTRDGRRLQAFDRRVYAITTGTICGF